MDAELGVFQAVVVKGHKQVCARLKKKGAGLMHVTGAARDATRSLPPCHTPWAAAHSTRSAACPLLALPGAQKLVVVRMLDDNTRYCWCVCLSLA